MKKIKTDILILGSGIAGLTLAIKLAEKFPSKKIIILNKTTGSESNSKYAQGGIAAVWDKENDDFEKHINDTLIAGDGLCDKEIVKLVVEEGPNSVREIIEWNTNFDKDENQQYKLTKEGGHSEKRILHFKDLTGFEMLRALIKKAENFKNIEIFENYFALDFITQHHLGYNIIRVTPDIECYGCYALNKNTNSIDTILSKVTVCCTGGIGQVYKTTTNSEIATGDGIAMFYRAKGRVENMEFVQFHPTSLYTKDQKDSSFLISEAVRGEGAVLRDHNGNEFMQNYDSRLSLASRDIVARAIDSEMKKAGVDFVYLDCTKIDKDKFFNHFPTIYNKCIELGIDPQKDMIPVVPACHYLCGGIRVDNFGRSSVKYLYAAGECASTGLHGANRLASNSLLECLVFSNRIFEDISKNIENYDFKNNVPDWNDEGTTDPQEMVLITQAIKELKEMMSYYVGIVRSNKRLKRALDRLYLLYQETEELYQQTRISPQLMELRNLITIGYLITRSALQRKESRGLHFNTDYPSKSEFIENNIL